MKNIMQVKLSTCLAAAIGFILLLNGCTKNADYETAMCALVDISGTYADQKKNVVKLIKAGLLPGMVPGDSLFLITIGSNSYDEKNLIHKVTLDYRPSEVNNQKLAFAKALDKFAEGTERSSHTDISGAMMLCGDHLKDTQAGTQLMFIFSDMEQDLKPGTQRKFEKREFADMHIAAMNVIMLENDNSNPQVYRDRLRKWEERVKGAGAKQWEVILEPAKILEFIEDAK